MPTQTKSNSHYLGKVLLSFFLLICNQNVSLFGQFSLDGMPSQEPPPELQDEPNSQLIGPNTNLVNLLDRVRVLGQEGKLEEAQSLAANALSKLEKNAENEFYLRQIKAEETKLYFKLANQAMLVREKAVAIQKEAGKRGQETSSQPGANTAIKVDLLRRAGLFSTADQLIEEKSAKISNDIIDKILSFQKYLIRKRDQQVYRIEDAMNFAKQANN